MSNFELQKTKFRTQAGFIAALDQSGGSTPKALKLYGIPETAYSGDAAMMDLIHAMRTRIITSPSFNGNRVLAAILFENTMDREIEGRPTAEYLWDVKKVVPILKVDKGLEAEANGVQLMKPMPELDKLLARAKAKGIFGTKMRSVIKQADKDGIQADVERMFETFPRLKERAQQLAGTMSGGEQQMLAMARALMSRPRLLLLDEPSMGLSPIMVEKIFEVIRTVHAQGTTLLLVEQNARLALQAADRGYVMDSGLITMDDAAARMLDDPRVRAAYLGEAG